MGSRIEYYRPRGIKGNYKITIILELKPDELAAIYLPIDHSYTMSVSSADFRQIEKHEGFEIHTCAIERTIYDQYRCQNKFLISITDRKIRNLYQLNHYITTVEEIMLDSTMQDLSPYFQKEFIPRAFIEYIPIELIDLDKLNNTPLIDVKINR